MLDIVKTIAIEKVAEQVGVSGWTIRTWIRSGLLSSHKIGRRVLLVEQEVRDLMARTYRPALRVANGNGSEARPPSGVASATPKVRRASRRPRAKAR